MLKLRTVIIVNVFLILFFVYSNYGIWSEFNSQGGLGTSGLGPVWIERAVSGAFIDGQWIAIGGSIMILNWPFWLFFISTAVNLYFIVKLVKSKQNQTSND